MKKHPYKMPEAAEVDLLYESLLCASEGDLVVIDDYGNGGDPFASF